MKKAKNIRKTMEQKAITLIALVVTIVVILILSGITVGMLTSDNGIIKETKEAKLQAEIENEKSILGRATMLTRMREKNGIITRDGLAMALKDEAGNNKTEVSEAGKVFEVLFVESNRYYEVDKDGIIGNEKQIIDVKDPGDITKNGKCDGTKDKPYEINCIEDLVSLSNLVNGSGKKLENGKAVEITNANNFEEKYIVLKRDLNFESKYSYADSTRTDFGDINGDDTDGNALITEMTTGSGFVPIGKYNIQGDHFKGNFNGENHKIENLYINSNNIEAVGLFGCVNATMSDYIEIGNFEISGNINYTFPTDDDTKMPRVGVIGLIGGSTTSSEKNVKISNIKSNCNIKGNNVRLSYEGGIIGSAYLRDDNKISIENCSVENSQIFVSGQHNKIGGLVGGACSELQTNGFITIKNSYAKCNLEIDDPKKSYHSVAGGIIGDASAGGANVTIENSYFIGEIKCLKSNGGIIGRIAGVSEKKSQINLNNVYTASEIKVGEYNGGIIGKEENTQCKVVLNNLYYNYEKAIGTNKLTDIVETNVNKVTTSNLKNEAFITTLNNNITSQDWRRWKLGSDKYPTFE